MAAHNRCLLTVVWLLASARAADLSNDWSGELLLARLAARQQAYQANHPQISCNMACQQSYGLFPQPQPQMVPMFADGRLQMVQMVPMLAIPYPIMSPWAPLSQGQWCDRRDHDSDGSTGTGGSGRSTPQSSSPPNTPPMPPPSPADEIWNNTGESFEDRIEKLANKTRLPIQFIVDANNNMWKRWTLHGQDKDSLLALEQKFVHHVQEKFKSWQQKGHHVSVSLIFDGCANDRQLGLIKTDTTYPALSGGNQQVDKKGSLTMHWANNNNHDNADDMIVELVRKARDSINIVVTEDGIGGRHDGIVNRCGRDTLILLSVEFMDLIGLSN